MQKLKKKKEKRKEKERGGAFSSLINAHIIVLGDNIVDGEKFNHFLWLFAQGIDMLLLKNESVVKVETIGFAQPM